MAAIKVCFVLGALFIAQCHTTTPDTHHPVGVKARCPETELQRDFDAQRMLGKWYSIEETGKEVACVCYHIEETRPGHYLGHFHPANITIAFAAINPDNVGEGYLIEAEEGSPLDRAVLKVIATDYETYAVVFTCKEFEDVVYPHSDIWSRSTEMSEEKLVELRAMLENALGADHRPVLKKVSHENCSYSRSEEVANKN